MTTAFARESNWQVGLPIVCKGVCDQSNLNAGGADILQKQMRIRPTLLVLAVAFAPTLLVAAANATPEFAQYHVAQRHAGASAPPILATRQDKEFQSQLRRGAQGRPNFAGHYRIVTFGCGASCVMGAIIDAQSGKVLWLPFTVCCGNDVGKPPVDFRPDSALIVINGMRNETGDGTHYYVLKHDQLTLIGSRPR